MKEYLSDKFIILNCVEDRLRKENNTFKYKNEYEEYLKQNSENYFIFKDDKKSFILCKIFKVLIWIIFIFSSIFVAYKTIACLTSEPRSFSFLYFILVYLFVVELLYLVNKDCKIGIITYKQKKKDLIKYEFYKKYIRYEIDCENIAETIIIDKKDIKEKQSKFKQILQDQIIEGNSYYVSVIIYIIATIMMIVSLNYVCIKIGENHYSLWSFLFASQNNDVKLVIETFCADYPILQSIRWIGIPFLFLNVLGSVHYLSNLIAMKISFFDKTYLFFNNIKDCMDDIIINSKKKDYSSMFIIIYKIISEIAIFFSFYIIPTIIYHNSNLELYSILLEINFDKVIFLTVFGIVACLTKATSFSVSMLNNYYLLDMTRI